MTRPGHPSPHSAAPPVPALRAGAICAWTFAWCFIILAGHGLAAPPAYESSSLAPPMPTREFRGVWVASVANIDWPSKPGLPAAQQQAELRALLEQAAQLRLNAVILQVRPACDALYASTLEPWSEYLTGRMGQPPAPLYDPLAFALAEAHARGLELHAWINPFRARHPSGTSPVAANHISQTRPGLVKSYGRHLWLDPGEAAARDHSLRVILDLVTRYDLDGIHLDDYFYPYKEKDASGNLLDFPDQPSWQRYQAGGGKLSREDWRRQNVNLFVEKLYLQVKAAKPWIKVGISPFGIWRNRVPPEITGFDPYDQLYADSRLWLREGWLDYFAPQLYWSIDAQGQSFPVLLNWWRQQNPKHRHVWPGLNVHRAGKPWPVEELPRQVQISRPGNHPGHLLWSATPLLANQGGVKDALAKVCYTNHALVPACAWLAHKTPARPKLYLGANTTRNLITVTMESPRPSTPPRWWVVQAHHDGQWHLQLLPGDRRLLQFDGPSFPQAIAVRAMEATGSLGPPAVLERKGAKTSKTPAKK